MSTSNPAACKFVGLVIFRYVDANLEAFPEDRFQRNNLQKLIEAYRRKRKDKLQCCGVNGLCFATDKQAKH